MLEAFIATITHTRNATLKLVADLTDDQLTNQPAPKMNHPAWVLGHLLLVESNFLTLLGGTAPALEALSPRRYCCMPSRTDIRCPSAPTATSRSRPRCGLACPTRRCATSSR